ncbi:MAG: SGNH/GDSL hydrolase family protein [Planctomycetota bacterium]
MRHCSALFVAFMGIATLLGSSGFADPPKTDAAADQGKTARQSRSKKPRPEYELPQVRSELPNVLLIGDSISIGYTLPVRKLLDGKANVFRPQTNCGPTLNGLKNLDAWLGDRKWDVIHFNFGLHDLKYMGPNGENLQDPKLPTSHQQVPIEQYEENLRVIAKRLKQTGAVVIWRETTPVPSGAGGRVPGDAARYNEAAARVIAELGGIETDPMHRYASVDPIRGLQRPSNVHYTAEGSQMLAQKVSEMILKALESKAASEQ